MATHLGAVQHKEAPAWQPDGVVGCGHAHAAEELCPGNAQAVITEHVVHGAGLPERVS